MTNYPAFAPFPSYNAVNEYEVFRGTHDAFTNLPDDSQLVYLVELHPYSATDPRIDLIVLPYPGVTAIGEFQFKYGGGEKTIRLSQSGFITKPTDSQPNRNYIGRVSDAIQIDSSIFGNTDFGASQSFGGIEILNPDGSLDYLYDYYWDDRDIVVKAGGIDFAYDQFKTIFKGKIASISGDERRILLSIGDNRAQVNQVVVAGTYGGGGGADGMPSIAGLSKPLLFGQVFGVQPVLVNYANQVFQLHDGAITSVQYVRDRGVQLTFNANVADVFAAAAPPPGTYNTSLATGMIRLGSTASGQVTVDAIGETYAGNMTGVDLAMKILTTRLGIYNLGLSDIDVVSFAKNRLDSPYTQGIYIIETLYGIDILNLLISGIDDYWSFTRTGALFFGCPTIAAAADSKIKRIKIDGVSVSSTIPAAYEVDVDYAKNYTVQSTADLAAATTDADRTFAMQEYRTVIQTDVSVRAKNKAASIRSFNTLIAGQADANTLLTKLFARYGVKRQVYEMIIYNPVYKYFVGDNVQLVHNRYGLDAGRNLLLSGISENASSNETKITVWG